MTAEGDACLIALLPHRALGGISIVVWLTAATATISLAQVLGLDSDHDDLDLGVRSARVELSPTAPDFTPLLACIREQLFAPLTVRRHGENRATVWARDMQDRVRRVGALGPPRGPLEWFRRRAPTSGIEIRFVDSEPPPIPAPSCVDRWFTRSRASRRP